MPMEMNTMEHGKPVKNTGMVFINSPMESAMKVIFIRIKDRALESTIGPMEKCTQAIGTMTGGMEKAILQINPRIKRAQASGKMIYWTDKLQWNLKIEQAQS